MAKRGRGRAIKPITVHERTKKDLIELGFEGEEAGWWLEDSNNNPYPHIGPYETKQDANEARHGLERFWKYEDK